MLYIRSNSIHGKAACFLLSICFAITTVITISTRKVEAIRPNSANSTTQVSSTPAPAQSKGKVNGKIVFTSERNNDKGLKLWSMNPDGSNPKQLTDESERNPTAPSYIHCYDGPAKWSPDGSKIALLSLRGDSAEEYSFYLINPDGSRIGTVPINGLLTSGDLPEILSFDWSPDGSKFVMDAGTHIVVDFGRFSTNIYSAAV